MSNNIQKKKKTAREKCLFYSKKAGRDQQLAYRSRNPKPYSFHSKIPSLSILRSEGRVPKEKQRAGLKRSLEI